VASRPSSATQQPVPSLKRLDLPLVTVVTPSYNQGRFIRATIESVLSQKYPNLEYIVMDGLSEDETPAICAEYADRLTFISEKDLGQSDAINKGFRRAHGEIVAWLNSDDVFLPGAIERAVEALLREPELGAVYGEGYQIDADGNVKQRFPVTESFNLWKLVYMSDYILQQTVFFRRTVFDEVGFLDSNLHYGLDWEILMRIGKRFMLRYLPYYMGSIREYGEAKTSTGGTARLNELASIMRRHGRRRFPPGYIIYGLETYERVWNDQIARFFRGRLSRLGTKLQGIVARICRKLMHHTIRECQGWYSDGWATERLHYMMPPGGGRFLEFDVLLPEGMFERQQVALEIAGKAVATETFAAGDYRLAIRLPERYWHETVEFTLVARRTFRPPPGPQGWDKRRLCYILRGVGYGERRAEIVRPAA
jgi:glycosyltransferase involved in cell wall biosynthesis